MGRQRESKAKTERVTKKPLETTLTSETARSAHMEIGKVQLSVFVFFCAPRRVSLVVSARCHCVSACAAWLLAACACACIWF